jgi:hypothetical protein
MSSALSEQKYKELNFYKVVFPDVSMLWSQFSAIFDNFRQKIGVFLQNQCHDKNFALFAFVLSQKRHFLQKKFRIFFLIITSVLDVSGLFYVMQKNGSNGFVHVGPRVWMKIYFKNVANT